MSRQHGKRKPPARSPARRPAAPARPVAPPPEDGAPPPPSALRKWGAIGAATVVAMLAVVSLYVGVVALVQQSDGEEVASGSISVPLTIGFLLLPLAFAALAFVSRHPRPSGATLRGTALVFVAVIVFLVVRDPVAAAIAGLGAGGTVALRREEGLGLRPRVWAVAIMTIYTAVLSYTLQAAALSVLPLVFAMLPIADSTALRNRARRAELAARRQV